MPDISYTLHFFVAFYKTFTYHNIQRRESFEGSTLG
jgi:hypothetical protein